MKNIIFDLGDVLIPIDLTAPRRHFAHLANLPETEVAARWNQHDIGSRYERGLLTDAAFRAAIRAVLFPENNVPGPTDADLDAAWNAVLLDVPLENFERVRALAGRYRLFLLSNTNALHIREVNRRLAALGLPTLETFFERVYYSHQTGLLKPDPASFGQVLTEGGLVANETFFFDDNLSNIRAAAALGIRAVQVCSPHTILTYLNEALPPDFVL